MRAQYKVDETIYQQDLKDIPGLQLPNQAAQRIKMVSIVDRKVEAL